MVDPAGRFFDNNNHHHSYSSPILEVGVENALQQISIDDQKFIKRGGNYNWSKKPTRITISGEVASGKSTVGKLLAERLKYEFESIGNITRNEAFRVGKSIVEFQQMCLEDKSIDLKLDSEFANNCNSKENIVVDYRVGFKFINNAYNIYLKIDEETAVERLKNSLRSDETYHTLSERNKLFKHQFMNAYSIDYTDPFNYQMVIKVEDFNSPHEIVNQIVKQIYMENNGINK
jgi:cytidylate kinase